MGRIAGGIVSALLLAAVIVAGHHFAASLAAETEVGAPPGKERAGLLWQRIKGLSGEWTGTSTRGWNEGVTYRVIAAESAVIETSFDAHPNETMVTMYHWDVDRLMLTHYCVARNQPRLVATSINEDASRATFTFLDGGNLPSRDTGHMDMLDITFHEDGSVVKQWHWHQDGRQAPMEQITLTRPAPETPAEPPAEDAEPHAPRAHH